MIRIKKTALIEDNKFLYQYKAFTGIVFDIIDEQVTDMFECKDGVRVTGYHSQFVPRNENDLCLDHTALIGKYNDDYEPFLYQDQGFTGIAYNFDEDCCIEEIRYIEGFEQESASWYDTGELEDYFLSSNNIAQTYEWHENRHFRLIDISVAKNRQTLKIKFTEKQEITSIDISADYLNKSPEFEHHLRYHYLVGYTFVEGACIAPRLFASGLGINDRVFSELQSCIGFNEMETLLLYMTSISTETLLSLKNHPALKSISVNDEREDIIQATRELKLKRPNCIIELNDIEI